MSVIITICWLSFIFLFGSLTLKFDELGNYFAANIFGILGVINYIGGIVLLLIVGGKEDDRARNSRSR